MSDASSYPNQAGPPEPAPTGFFNPVLTRAEYPLADWGSTHTRKEDGLPMVRGMEAAVVFAYRRWRGFWRGIALAIALLLPLGVPVAWL